METEPKTPTLSEAILVLLASFVFSTIPTLAVLAFFPEGENEAITSFGRKLSLAVGELSLIFVPLIFLRLRNFPVAKCLRLRAVPRHILWASVGVTAGLVVIMDEIDRLIQLILPMPQELTAEISSIMEIHSGLDLALILLSAVILAGVIEETLFRGFLQRVMEEQIGVTNAVVYSSLAFTLVHVNIYTAVQIFLLGFALGYLAWRTDSIVPSMICHGVNNALAIFYYNGGIDRYLPWYEWGDHVSPLVWLVVAVPAYVGFRTIEAHYRTASSRSPNDGEAE